MKRTVSKFLRFLLATPVLVFAIAGFVLCFGWIIKIPYDCFKAWLEGDYEILVGWAYLVIVGLILTVILLIANLKVKQEEWERREDDLRKVIRHLEEQLLNKSESQETDD